jgi:chromosome segregation ATPase
MSDIVSGERVRWLTYAEAGQLLGVKGDSVRRHAMRAKWKRQQGNEGKALVAVPLDILADVAGDKSAPDKAPDIRGDVARGMPASREALARQETMAEALRSFVARLEAERAGLIEDAAQARQEAQDARALAERRGEEVAELREKLARQEALQPLVERLQADRDAVTAELASVYQEAQEARALADGRAVELANTRERAGAAEGKAEGLQAALRAAEAHAATLQAEVARERAVAQALLQAEAAERQAAEEARAELAAWTAGGPLTRALRAFFRRG